MARIDVNRIIGIIKRYFPKDATEISDVLDLLNLALDGLMSSTNKMIAEFHKNKEFDKGMELWEFSKTVSAIQEKINEYSASISINAEMDEEEIEEELDEIEEQKSIPNYSDYVVDSSIPHTLYEDFTHKKVVAFSFNNKRYTAKNWKDLLLQTCDLLAEIDAKKFYEFLDDPVMKGREVSYFSRKYVNRKNEELRHICLD
jgi:Na+/phosphate symporter